MIKTIFVASIFVPFLALAAVNDDAHNHDGSHPDGERNCGGNYMLPGAIARLGSHSFPILARDGKDHVIVEHRSGTPPHNYQFLFRVRFDDQEMKDYEEILAASKTLPAFTTIYFDKDMKQLDRTFFCLQDLPKIFGSEKKKGDEFEKLFPIRASLQKNPDHEGSFEIEKSVVRGKFVTLDRDDFELIVYRYIPAYLPQDLLRQQIETNYEAIAPLFDHAPLTFDESKETASRRKPFMATDGLIKSKGFCPSNFYVKNAKVPETIHTFILLAQLDPSTVLASHYYDQAPQNFQTILKLKIGERGMQFYNKARNETNVPPLFQARDAFYCMQDIRKLVTAGKFTLKGQIYRNSDLRDYRLGQAVGEITIASKDIEVLMNRKLESLMNLRDVVASTKEKGVERKGTGSKKEEY